MKLNCRPSFPGWVQLGLMAKALLLGLALAGSGAWAVPTFERFEPTAEVPGAWVIWHGTDLGEVTGVRISGQVCRFKGSSDGRALSFEVPAGLRPGSRLVTVNYGAGGTARSLVADRSFRVLVPGGSPPEVPGGDAGSLPEGEDPFVVVDDPPPPPADTPVIRTMVPHSGAPGTRVTLTGAGLGTAIRINLGVTPVTAYRRVGHDKVILNVPAGHPASAEFILYTPGSRCWSPRFTVTGERHLGPRVTRFTPERGRPGELVTIEGSHLQEVVGVIVGGKECPACEYLHGHLLAIIDAHANGTVPIILLHRPQADRAEVQEASVSSFEIIPPAPVVTRLNPAEGPPGTPVVLNGYNLQQVEGISFGRSPAGSFTQVSATEVWAVAPPDADRGPLTIRTRHGETSDTPGFNPVERQDPIVLRLERMSLTQAVQRPDGSVPLVARRDGLLRIFLQADRGNALQARVRVRLRPAAGEDQIREVVLEGPGVPTVLDEERLTSTCNLFLDAEEMLPGLSLRVELLPMAGAALAEGLDCLPREGGYQTLDLHPVPPLKITFLPLRQRNLTGDQVGNITADNLASYVAPLRAMLPISEIEAEVGPELVTGEALQSSESCNRVLEAVYSRRLDDLPRSEDRYYLAIFHKPKGGALDGLSLLATEHRRCMSGLVFDASAPYLGRTFRETLVHEMGHMMGRWHAPGVTAKAATDLIDPNYPFQDGSLGVVGMDLPGGMLLDPQRTFDVMGYDDPVWVSDHTYEGIFNYLTGRSEAPPAP